VAEPDLRAVPALSGSEAGADAAPWRHRAGDVELVAIERRRILTLAFSPRQGPALATALDMELPIVGDSCTAGPSRRLLGVQQDQLWLIDDEPSTSAPDVTGLAWMTDQSDGWSSIAIGGQGVLPVLERLVPLDIAAIAPGQLGRTVIEHLAAIVLRTDSLRFELLSPRSSIASFAHALQGAADEVAAEAAVQRASRPAPPLEY